MDDQETERKDRWTKQNLQGKRSTLLGHVEVSGKASVLDDLSMIAKAKAVISKWSTRENEMSYSEPWPYSL